MVQREVNYQQTSIWVPFNHTLLPIYGIIRVLNHCPKFQLRHVTSPQKIKKNNQKLANNIEKTDSTAFYDLLNGPSLAGSFEHYQPEHRNRVYTPSVTLSMFLSQVLSKDCPCQKVVDDLLIKRMAQDLPAISSSTSADCQARKAISLDLIASLTQSIGTLLDDNVPPQWTLQGRNSRVVDGTTMLMPDTEENQIAFPQPSTQKEGLGFPTSNMPDGCYHQP
jgi:hypothetical protein